ncbi:MAG: NADH-quinone oxidoreductase subunit N [Pseudomonadota bacterium]
MENFLGLYFDAMLPGAFILTLGCVILLVTAFCKHKADGWIYYGTQLGLLISIALIFRQIACFPDAAAIAHERFRIDHCSILGGILIIALSFFALFYSRKDLMRQQLPIGEYVSLVLFSIVGMLVMTTAYHFLTLYIALELMSFPLYILCAYHRKSSKGSEAALKYFVTGALASGFLLFGISLIYGVAHSFGFVNVGIAFSNLTGADMIMALVGVAFVLAGLAFKLGLAPFHMWVPDVYEGAPPSLTLFLVGAPKIAVFILFARLLQTAFVPLVEHWQQMLYLIAILSILIGNVAALTQTNLRRMLAYSSIAHMGFMLFGFAVGSITGLSAALFYMITYVILSVGAFAAITLLNYQTNSVETISDLSGLSRRHPWLAFIILLLVFSMAGIPPTVGFIAKLSILMSLLEAGQVVVAVFMVLMSIVGLYYYLRVIKVMYFDEPAKEPIYAPAISSSSILFVSLTGIFALLIGIFPAELLQLCQTVLV